MTVGDKGIFEPTALKHTMPGFNGFFTDLENFDKRTKIKEW